MDMRRGYYEDIQLLKGPVPRIWFVILLTVLAILPLVVSNYNVYLINAMAINVIVALGLNILIGYTGQVSLGHAGFVAIGAYATLLLMTKLSLPFLPALLLAGLITAGFGFLMGLPALRLEGPYLAIATLGFGLAVTQTIGRSSFFGGHMGLQAPDLVLGPFQISGDKQLYAIIIPITVIMALAARNLTQTRVGRAFLAIRDSDIAAQTLGVNVAYYKTLAFAVSAFYAGVAGGLWAFLLDFINPGMFDFFLSILFLAMVVVGGAGSHLGAVLGACLVTFLNLKLQNIGELPLFGPFFIYLSQEWMSTTGLPNVRFIIFGLILIAVVLFEPSGLYGFWLRIKNYWRTWPF